MTPVRAVIRTAHSRVVRGWLAPALGFALVVQPGFAQEAGVTIALDTVAVLSSTPDVPVTGTSVLDRVGSHYVVADLLHADRLRIHDATGAVVRFIPGAGEESTFSRIAAIKAVGDSVAVFDGGRHSLFLLDLVGNTFRTAALPLSMTNGGGIVADGSIVTVSAPGGSGPRVAMVDADGVRPMVLAAGEGHGGASGLDDMRLLARGVEGTFWLLHFVTYRAEQYHLTSGDLIQSIHREVPWLMTGSGAGDWRYASLLDAHQPSADRLWVLGRSLDPAYTASSRASAESPLAGRQAAWDLQLDLLSLPGGDVVASLTLPYWVGGFTSDGLFYFFDEVEGDRGRIVITRLRLESVSDISP